MVGSLAFWRIYFATAMDWDEEIDAVEGALELTDELRQKLYDEEDFGGKLVAYLREHLDDVTGDQKKTDSQQRRLGDRATFAIEIGAYWSPILRHVDLWAGGQRLTTKDNAAYVPAFAHRLQTSAAQIRSERMPASPFQGMTAEHVHRLLHADNESDFREQFWIMQWGETTDNFAAYAYGEDDDVVLSFQFYGDGNVFTVRTLATELAATLEAAATLLLAEHQPQA